MALQAGQPLEASIGFGPDPACSLTYRVLPDGSPAATLCAEFASNAINVRIPAETVEAWAAGAELGISGQLSWAGGSLSILVEKDLQRLNPKAGEDEG